MKAPPILRKQLQKKERGFVMLAAIFILVVLTALGAFVVSVSTNQQVGSALDVQGVRVYQAARSGIDWGLYQRLQASSCLASTSFVPAAPTLAGFTVTVTCTTTVDASGGPTIIVVRSTACNQPTGGNCPNITTPGANYLERSLEVNF
jgi:MSHA biogenesis protein MshP